MSPLRCHSATRAAQQYSRTIATSNRARSWANLKRRFHATCGNAPSATDLSVVADTQHRSVAHTQQSDSPRSDLRACTTCILTRPLQVHALPSTGVARRTAFEPARLPCTSHSTHRWSRLQSFLGEGGKHVCQSSTREVAGPAGCSRPGRRVYRAVVEFGADRPILRRVRIVVAAHQ